MKIKIEFNAEEVAGLSTDSAPDIIEEAHALLDECIERRQDCIKCAITIDSEKE